MDLINTKWVNRNLVFYDKTYKHRWTRAIGPNVISFEMPLNGGNFDATTGDPTWGTCTIVETGLGGSTTQVPGLTAGVGLKITTDNAEYDGLNLQAYGTPFTFTVGKPLYFGVKFQTSEATQDDVFLGLTTTNSAVLTAAAHTIHASTTSHAGFYKLDAGTAVKYASEKSGSLSSSSAGTLTTAAHIYEMYWDGASSGALTFWFDGTQVGQVTSTSSNIATSVAMRPTIVFRTGNAAAEVANVHWMRVIQIDT